MLHKNDSMKLQGNANNVTEENETTMLSKIFFQHLSYYIFKLIE